MEGEQTWPTEEEILAAENKMRKVLSNILTASVVFFNPDWLLD